MASPRSRNTRLPSCRRSPPRPTASNQQGSKPRIQLCVGGGGRGRKNVNSKNPFAAPLTFGEIPSIQEILTCDLENSPVSRLGLSKIAQHPLSLLPSLPPTFPEQDPSKASCVRRRMSGSRGFIWADWSFSLQKLTNLHQISWELTSGLVILVTSSRVRQLEVARRPPDFPEQDPGKASCVRRRLRDFRDF